MNVKRNKATVCRLDLIFSNHFHKQRNRDHKPITELST
jgi:hypothetical protein